MNIHRFNKIDYSIPPSAENRRVTRSSANPSANTTPTRVTRSQTSNSKQRPKPSSTSSRRKSKKSRRDNESDADESSEANSAFSDATAESENDADNQSIQLSATPKPAESSSPFFANSSAPSTPKGNLKGIVGEEKENQLDTPTRHFFEPFSPGKFLARFQKNVRSDRGSSAADMKRFTDDIEFDQPDDQFSPQFTRQSSPTSPSYGTLRYQARTQPLDDEEINTSSNSNGYPSLYQTNSRTPDNLVSHMIGSDKKVLKEELVRVESFNSDAFNTPARSTKSFKSSNGFTAKLQAAAAATAASSSASNTPGGMSTTSSRRSPLKPYITSSFNEDFANQPSEPAETEFYFEDEFQFDKGFWEKLKTDVTDSYMYSLLIVPISYTLSLLFTLRDITLWLVNRLLINPLSLVVFFFRTYIFTAQTILMLLGVAAIFMASNDSMQNSWMPLKPVDDLTGTVSVPTPIETLPVDSRPPIVVPDQQDNFDQPPSASNPKRWWNSIIPPTIMIPKFFETPWIRDRVVEYNPDSSELNEEIRRLLTRISTLETQINEIKVNEAKQRKQQEKIQKDLTVKASENQLRRMGSEITEMIKRLESETKKSVGSVESLYVGEMKTLQNRVLEYNAQVESVVKSSEDMKSKVQEVISGQEKIVGKVVGEEVVREHVDKRVQKIVDEFLPEFVAARIEDGKPIVDSRLWDYLEKRLATVASLRELESDVRRESEGGLHEAFEKIVDLEGRVILKQDLGDMLTKLVTNQLAEFKKEQQSSTVSETEISKIVKDEIARYALDPIDEADYGLETSGARVDLMLTSFTYSLPFDSTHKEALKAKSKGSMGKLFGLFKQTEVQGEEEEGKRYVPGMPPRIALWPDKSMGQCWAMEGTKGQLGIKLARPIFPTHFAIDHLSLSSAFSPPEDGLSSAPRKVEFWGVFDTQRFTSSDMDQAKNRVVPVIDTKKKPNEGEIEWFPGVAGMLLQTEEEEFNVYEKERPQKFVVKKDVVERLKRSGKKVGHVVVRVKSNWGYDKWTCLYRVKVHGNE